MANKNNNNRSSNVWSLNKVSFLLIVASAILYLVGLILHFVGLDAVTGWLQGVATAIMICVVSVLAWRYVRNRGAVWIVLYIMALLVVLVGIVIPLIA